MSDIYGTETRVAPSEVSSQAVGNVEITGTPIKISVRGSGASSIKFAPSTAAPGGTAWPIADGETVTFLVTSLNRFMHVVSGTILWHKS